MRTRSIHLVIAVALGLFATGCAFQKPTLRFKNAQLRETTFEGTTLDLTYTLKNPNPIGLSLASLSYGLEVEGHHVVSGKPPNGLKVPSQGSSDLVFPAHIKFQDIVPVVQVFLQKDQAAYTAKGEVGISTPLGVLRLPISYSSTFPVPKLPTISLQSPVIQSLSLAGARVVFPIQVSNRNPFPLPLGGLNANLKIAGASIGSASATSPANLAAGGAQIVELPVNISFAQTGMAVANALRTRSAHVKLDGSLNAGGMAIPVDLSQVVSFR